MYLRKTTIYKNGKSHTYWRVARSCRQGTRVRQETIASLTGVDERGYITIRALLGTLSGSAGEGKPSDKTAMEKWVCVQGQNIRFERVRSFGDVWLALQLWRAFRLDGLMRQVIALEDPGDPGATILKMQVLARVCKPCIPLHKALGWLRQTAIDDLLGIRLETLTEDSLSRALDRLIPAKDAVSRHLHTLIDGAFLKDCYLIVYDLTALVYGNSTLTNTQLEHGDNTQHKQDGSQLCIALMTAGNGVPFGYEVFVGNCAEVGTLKEIVRAMETRYGPVQHVWILGNVLVGEDTLDFLRREGRPYVVEMPPERLTCSEERLAEKPWIQIREGLEVQLCHGVNGRETSILYRNTCRCENTKAMHQTSDLAAFPEQDQFLRSNVLNWDFEALSGVYLRLKHLDSVFRIESREKSSRFLLDHQEDRLEARVFVSFLAYCLRSMLQKWHSEKGLNHDADLLLDELGGIQTMDLVVHTTDATEVRVRCIVKPNRMQNELLTRLGVELPMHLNGQVILKKYYAPDLQKEQIPTHP